MYRGRRTAPEPDKGPGLIIHIKHIVSRERLQQLGLNRKEKKYVLKIQW
jgi:hypothetical protein